MIALHLHELRALYPTAFFGAICVNTPQKGDRNLVVWASEADAHGDNLGENAIAHYCPVEPPEPIEHPEFLEID